jgi:Flp pilus assembly protein TadG
MTRGRPSTMRSRGRFGRGQALVEFALVLPVFLLVVLALFDTGKGIFSNNTIAQAAREGARLASVEVSWVGAVGGNCTAPACPADTTALRMDVVTALNRMTIGVGTVPSGSVFIHCHAAGTNTPASTASWNGCGSANTIGNVVTVRVDYLYQPIIGNFFRWATAGTLALSAATTMAIN